MSRKKSGQKRREYSAELKEEAVQMLLDGHSAESVVSNLGLGGASLVYRWKARFLETSGPAAGKLEARVCQLEEELRRVERERDILKKVAPRKAWEEGILSFGADETSHRNPVWADAHPAERNRQPEASLAWCLGNRHCEA
jgi:transposase